MKIEVTAFPRALQGSSASRRLCVTGKVPGIIYGADKKAQTVELDHKEMLRNLGLEAFHASILDMKLGEEKFQALLRDYQMHPWKKQVVHVDFQRVDKNRKIHMRVPLHFVNAEICPGVKAKYYPRSTHAGRRWPRTAIYSARLARSSRSNCTR